uniref:Alternative protein MMP24 n=1 Tax=Homo sapiens TaxID=9606 RepID=L8E8C1_HUMAN|nr:alternative protein MMP24 [Homo sapiens]
MGSSMPTGSLPKPKRCQAVSSVLAGSRMPPLLTEPAWALPPTLWSLGLGSAYPVAQTGTPAALGAVSSKISCPRGAHVGPLCPLSSSLFFLILAKGRLPGTGREQLRRY